MALLTEEDWAEIEADGIAAEYALGLLTATEAEAAAQVMALDPDVADAVGIWAAGFAALSDAGLPRVPPPELRARICEPDAKRGWSAAVDGAPRAWLSRQSNRLGGALPVAAAFCAVVGLAVLGWLTLSRMGPDLQGQFTGDGVPALTAQFDPSSRMVSVSPGAEPVTVMPPFDKTYALWSLTDEGPVFVGMLDTTGHLTAPWPGTVPGQGARLLLTQENRGVTRPSAPSRVEIARATFAPDT